MKKGIQGIDNNLFYLNDDGTIYIGWKKLDDKTYYFGTDGFAYKGFNGIDEKTYFFSYVNSTLKHGWQSIDGKAFYLNEDGTVNVGWRTIKGESYYFGYDFYAYSGLREIDGIIYYFNTTNYNIETGLQEINNKLYYLNEDGSIYYGWLNAENKTYYFGADGYALQGFHTLDGKNYFFSYVNSTLKQGWQQLDNNIFYLTAAGEVVYGNQTIENRDYIFNEQGYLQGFVCKGNNMYYCNPDGTLAKGVQRMVGRYYKFNEMTGAFEKYVNQKIVVDISSHNGVVDWETVKKSGQVDAVILRLGYGVGYMDTQFLNNVKELNRLGIPYSVYLFSYAENAYESELEANFVINTIKNNSVYIASNLFGIYYDLEDWQIKSTGENSYSISKDTYRKMITTFTHLVQQNLGIKSRVYASKNYIETRFPEDVRSYVTWIAQWGPTLTYQGAYEGWQYTSDGTIPGISGRVDVNIFYY